MANCLSYLEFQKMYNEEDIFLSKEIKMLFDYVFKK